MYARLLALTAVAAAVAGILWLKQDRAGPVADPGREPGAHSKVLLFADLREAGSSCACAEVIRLARATDELPGVAFEEFDPRERKEVAERHGVRVLPTVLVLGSDGAERGRFEGESQQVIGALRSALESLASAHTTVRR